MTTAVLLAALLGCSVQDQPVITVDTTEVPDVRDWAEKARALCEKWYPTVSDLLASRGFTPPRQVRLVFKDEKKGVAWTTGTTITIMADWIRKHPDDFGMVIHELCHVVQSYGHGVGWITEGIADYVRYFKYEPGPTPPKVGSKASYKDGYKTTATFFAWIEKTKDKEIVRKLNALMRTGGYKDELFREWTGSDLDSLWKEFLAAQR